jgi:hypothetical protein
VKKTAAFTTLAVALGLLAVSCGGAGGGDPMALLADARKEASERGVPILVDFYTDW